MTRRTVSGYLLLLLIAVSATELALDSAVFRAPMRQQWRMQAPEHAAGHLRQRNATGIRRDLAATPVLARAGELAVIARPEALAPLLAAIFVPPRA